jgi:murein DD-endopeptidase MepM/ murein hydrolase activator NlpD
MLKYITVFRYQILIWLVVLASVSTNIYLIVTQPEFDYPEYQDAALDGLDPSEANAKIYKISSYEVHTIPQPPPQLSGNLSRSPTTIIPTKSFILSKTLSSAGANAEDIAKIETSLKSLLPKNSIQNCAKVIITPQATKNYAVDKLTLEFSENKIEVTYDPKKNKYVSQKIAFPLETKTKLISGKIQGSLYSSARRSGADAELIKEFINLLSYSVDFQRDVRAGDNFRIFYEYQTNHNNKTIKKPQIVYASLSVDGEQKEVFKYYLPSGKVDYFDGKGNSVRRSLLRTPINGAKISSSYGMRNHPIHGYSLMHKGVDFSAPRGTPILVAGDGVVKKVSSQARGYGNFVEIEHNKSYSTLYAHMSKFATAIKPGKRVKQGQVIGYVGATGQATGPHLHYEVIHNGKKINPSKVSFPKTPPLTGGELAKFKKALHKIEVAIAGNEYSARNKVAKAENSDKNANKINKPKKENEADPL